MPDMFAGKVLLIPQKSDPERDSVADAWQGSGGEVVRIDRFWEPPAISDRTVRVYGNSLFCLVLAEKLSLQLVSPPDDFLLTISTNWLKRAVYTTTLGELDTVQFPCFAKPLVPKLFRAGVYTDRMALLYECAQLETSTGIIISEIVSIEAEARAFILDNRILALAVYEGTADAAGGRRFLEDFLQANPGQLPRTVVVDIAVIAQCGWAILEANAAWGAGLNGCNPVAVLPCIDAATHTERGIRKHSAV